MPSRSKYNDIVEVQAVPKASGLCMSMRFICTPLNRNAAFAAWCRMHCILLFFYWSEGILVDTTYFHCRFPIRFGFWRSNVEMIFLVERELRARGKILQKKYTRPFYCSHVAVHLRHIQRPRHLPRLQYSLILRVRAHTHNTYGVDCTWVYKVILFAQSNTFQQ